MLKNRLQSKRKLEATEQPMIVEAVSVLSGQDRYFSMKPVRLFSHFIDKETETQRG